MFYRWQYLLFFFNDTATTEIYTLSLHDALPICKGGKGGKRARCSGSYCRPCRLSRPCRPLYFAPDASHRLHLHRSEEHTSELQSLAYLVCRLLLEKKKQRQSTNSLLNRLYRYSS